ncbi:MAG: MATE family efflux transporter, partial [Aeromonas sp.]
LAGARQFERAYKQLLHSLKLGLIVTTLIAIAAAMNGERIISLFTADGDIIRQVAQLFMVSLILEPGRTFNLVVINALRATGDARFPLLVGVASMWGIAVPLAYFFGIMQGYGLVGIWLALACDEWVRGLAMFWRWRSRRWQNKVLVAVK